MNFIITEDECNSLDAARAQLNMVAELFTGNKRGQALYIDPVDTSEFLFAQVATLKGVIEATEARHRESYEQRAADGSQPTGNVLSGADLADIFSLLSGQAPLTKGRVKELGRQLQEFAHRDASLMPMLTAWTIATTDGARLDLELSPGADDQVMVRFVPKAPVEVSKAAAGKKPPRKRERLSAAAGV